MGILKVNHGYQKIKLVVDLSRMSNMNIHKEGMKYKMDSLPLFKRSASVLLPFKLFMAIYPEFDF